MTDGNEAPLHPTPRLTRQRWTDLSGPWQFCYDDGDEGLDGQLADPARALRPHHYRAVRARVEAFRHQRQGFSSLSLYRKSFTERPDAGGRLLLHFGAVDYRTHVWVNGRLGGDA